MEPPALDQAAEATGGRGAGFGGGGCAGDSYYLENMCDTWKRPATATAGGGLSPRPAPIRSGQARLGDNAGGRLEEDALLHHARGASDPRDGVEYGDSDDYDDDDNGSSPWSSALGSPARSLMASPSSSSSTAASEGSGSSLGGHSGPIPTTPDSAEVTKSFAAPVVVAAGSATAEEAQKEEQDGEQDEEEDGSDDGEDDSDPFFFHGPDKSFFYQQLQLYRVAGAGGLGGLAPSLAVSAFGGGNLGAGGGGPLDGVLPSRPASGPLGCGGGGVAAANAWRPSLSTITEVSTVEPKASRLLLPPTLERNLTILIKARAGGLPGRPADKAAQIRAAQAALLGLTEEDLNS
eukprot:SM000002S05535  [mRNA]  locus=s2:622107:623497:- [translate_table: standard]